MKYLSFICLTCFFSATIFAQDSSGQVSFDLSIFSDGAHHWYDINEKESVIKPRPGHQQYKPTEITAIADNILLFQKDNGGWPKNYDMQAILTPDQVDSVLKTKSQTNTTFDNRCTYSQVGYLAKVYTATKIEKYRDAALKGLEFIIRAQYPNGGWPQYYPLENNYSRYITYNDDAMAGIMYLLKEVIDNKPEFEFVQDIHYLPLKTAWDKGLDCILKTQINDAGKPTAWCQQYNEVDLQPAWARKFEPPSICNGESPKIVLLLMSIDNPSKEIVDAIENAVAWFRGSAIKGIRVETVSAPELKTPFRISTTDRVVVQDSTAKQIWPRYNELKTHRPLFCNRDSKVVYSLAEVDRERRDGYSWYTYEPQKVLDKYAGWSRKIHTIKD